MHRTPNRRVDLSVYVRAFGVFARNPTVIILPLVVEVISLLVDRLGGIFNADAYTGGLQSFILLLMKLFALGAAIIIADEGWRRGVASFDDAWQDARARGGDLLFAAFGFTFVLQIAQYAGSFIGVFGVIVDALAIFGLIFAIPAAAIGGVPGGAAINASIERVRSAPLTAGILTSISIVVLLIGPTILSLTLAPFDGDIGGSPLVGQLIDVLIRSIATGYVAIVMAKVYADVAFTRL
jgi:hypothetical protein